MNNMTNDQVLNELKIKLFDSMVGSQLPDYEQSKKLQEFVKNRSNDEKMLKALDDLDKLREKALTAWSIIYDFNDLTKKSGDSK